MPYFQTSDLTYLYYEDEGEGQPIIFIHGWSMNHSFFRYQTEHFSTAYRTIAIDLRGHGKSDRPEYGVHLARLAQDIHEFMESLDLDNVHLVCWSMGVHVLFDYIRQFGTDRLASVCSIDMSPKILIDEEWKLGAFSALTKEANLEFLNRLVTDFDEAISKGIWTVSPECNNQELLTWIHQAKAQNTPHILIHLWISMAANDYRSILPTIDVPFLIAYGEKSLLYTKDVAEYMMNHTKNGQLASFKHSGHSPHIEEPQTFNHSLEQFFNTL